MHAVNTNHLEHTVNFIADKPCLVEFDNEQMFHRKFVILQGGTNVLNYFEGKGHYYEYPLEIVQEALPIGKPGGHDVPVP